jgi:hypothetical protein
MRYQSLVRSADTVDMATTGVLFLDCPDCGTIFESALGMDRLAHEFKHVDQMLEQCPTCRTAARYDRNDYRYGVFGPYFRPSSKRW